MSAIETGVRDTLNAGLGLVKTIEEQFSSVQSQVENGYTDLIAKGAADKSEGVVKLRVMLDQGISQVKEAQTKVASYFQN